MLGFLSVMVRPAAGRPVRTRDVVFILVVSVAGDARNLSLRLVVVWYRGSFRSIDNSSGVGSNRIIVFPLSSSSAMSNVEGGVYLNCRNEETQAPPPFIYIHIPTAMDTTRTVNSPHDNAGPNLVPHPILTQQCRDGRLADNIHEDNHGNIAAKESRLSTIKSHAVRRARRLARYQCAVLRF